MLERIVNMSIRFFVGVWVVRYLGPERYGIYSYAISFVALFAAFATLGLDGIVIRNLTREGTDTDKILSSALVLRLAAALGAVGVVAAIVFSTQDDRLIQIAVFITAFDLILRAADVFDLWFQAKILSKYPVMVRSVTTVCISAAQVAFILLELPLLAFVGLVLAGSAVQGAGIVAAFLVVRTKRMRFSFQWDVARRLIRSAWPLMIAALSVTVYMKVDQVMLGEMVGASEVGIYATAVRISELWYFIPVSIAGSVFPQIVRLKEQAKPGVLHERMQHLYDLMALLSYGVAIPMTFLAEPIISLLFGHEYLPAAGILQIHIWAFVFVSLGVARGKWLVAEDYVRFSMVSTLLGAIVNVALNWVLIPVSEGAGAAWATLVSQAVAAYFTCLLLAKTRGTFLYLTKSLFAPLRLYSILKSISYRKE